MAREVKKKVKVKGPKGQTGWCILYTDGMIRVDWVRLSYPHLAKAYKGSDDDAAAAFGVVGLLQKKNREAKDLIKERIEELLKENKVKALPADKKFLRDGDQSGKAECEGMFTISTRETRRPPLRNRDNSVVEPEDATEVFRPGYWGSILIRPWYQNNKFGKRVNSGLASVQFMAKDEEFGEGRLSDEDLDDTFEDHGDPDDDDAVDDDEDERPARKPASKSRKPADDDYDDDEDERPARKPKKRRPVVEDDDDDDI